MNPAGGKQIKSARKVGLLIAALLAGAFCAVLALGVQACGGSESSQTETVAVTTVVQTITATRTTRTSDGGATSTTETLPPGTVDIRSIDWKSIVDAKPMLRDVEDVIYSDLTGDGKEDALVLVRVEGTGAYLDYYVFTVNGDAVINLFENLGVSHGKVELGQLPQSFVDTTAVYGQDDPNCCPSNLLKTTYQWSTSAGVFTAVMVDMAPNPDVPSS